MSRSRGRVLAGTPRHLTKALGRFAVNKVTNRLITLGYEVVVADYAYDLIVRSASGFLAVEVKTGTRQQGNCYVVNICRGGGSRGPQRAYPTRDARRYTRKDFDLLVAYVQAPGRNAYFVLPPRVFERHNTVYLSLETPCQWERYRDAWHLVGEPVTDPLFETLWQ